MHELAQIPPLLGKIRELKAAEGASEVLRANLQMGILFPMSPEILKIHLAEAVRGTDLENIDWIIMQSAGPDDPGPADLLLESLELNE